VYCTVFTRNATALRNASQRGAAPAEPAAPAAPDYFLARQKASNGRRRLQLGVLRRPKACATHQGGTAGRRVVQQRLLQHAAADRTDATAHHEY